MERNPSCSAVGPRWVQLMVVAVTALLVAACGSTVAPSAVPAGGNGTSQQLDGLGAVSGGGGAGRPQSGSGVGASLGTNANPAPAGPGAGGPAGVTSSGAGTGGVGSPGSSSTAVSANRTPVKVGLLYSSNAQAALSALGAKGSIGDAKAEGDAVIAYLNAHGGMGGRKIVADWYNGDATQSPSDIGNEACAAWTQDGHVDAAVPGGSIVDMNTVRACLNKTGTPAISVEYHVQTRRANYANSPNWVEPLGMSMESLARSYVDGLVAEGFFRGGKVGIVYDDGADWTAVEQSVLEPELARHNVSVAQRASYQLRGFSDVASSQSTLNAMILRFKTAGVNRVIFLEPWDGYAFFMQAADSQHYNPVYGLSSQAAFAASYATGLIPADQLTGAYFVGWSPVLDVSGASASWRRAALCLDIYHRAGIKLDGPLAEAIGLSSCDGLLDLAELGSAVGGNLNRSTYRPALDRISWESALLPATRVSAARPYGITTLRAGRWRPACTCFAFSGPSWQAAA